MLPTIDCSFSSDNYSVNKFQQPLVNDSINCIHQLPAQFLCRHYECLSTNQYIICAQQCLISHIDHPQDLINFQIFSKYMPLLQSKTENLFIKIRQKIQEFIDKFLRIRMSVNVLIDEQIANLKKLQQSYNIKNSSQTILTQNIKQWIYKIQQYTKKDQQITFKFQQYQQQQQNNIDQLLKNCYNKTSTKIQQFLNLNILQSVSQNLDNIYPHNKTHNKIKRQYKIQGNIYQIVYLLKSMHQHVDHIKIYLNSDLQKCGYLYRYGQNTIVYVLESNYYTIVVCNIYVIQSRNYKQTYQTLMRNLSKLTQLKYITLVVWDNYLLKQNKLQLIKLYRKQLNVDKFTIDDKLKGLQYDI